MLFGAVTARSNQGNPAVLRPQGLSVVYFISALVLVGCTGSGDNGNGGDAGDSCNPNDQDGVIGGNADFILTVNDLGFSPLVLTAQNSANVTLELVNAGTKTHDFVVDCVPTPNGNGCASTSCFPEQADIEPLAPGQTAVTSFFTPRVEGIYFFHSSVPGDTDGPCAIDNRGCGQFVVK